MVRQLWARAGVLGRSMWGYTSFTQETSVEACGAQAQCQVVEPRGACNGGSGLTSCLDRGADNRQGSLATQSIRDRRPAFPRGSKSPPSWCPELPPGLLLARSPLRPRAREAGWWMVGSELGGQAWHPCSEMTVLPPAEETRGPWPSRPLPTQSRSHDWGLQDWGPRQQPPASPCRAPTVAVRLVPPPRKLPNGRLAELGPKPTTTGLNPGRSRMGVSMQLCQDAQCPVILGQRTCPGPSGRRACSRWVASTCIQSQPGFRPVTPREPGGPEPHALRSPGQDGGGRQ